MEDLSKMLPKILKAWRYKEEMSMGDAAKWLGVSTATYCRIENGNPMEQKTMIKLINMLFNAEGK